MVLLVRRYNRSRVQRLTRIRLYLATRRPISKGIGACDILSSCIYRPVEFNGAQGRRTRGSCRAIAEICVIIVRVGAS